MGTGDLHVTTICNAAKEFVDRGWSVFPISYDKRIPLSEWKEFQTRFVTEEEIDDWEANGAPTKSGARVSPFNLGLATGKISGIVIVDCDNDDAIEFAKRNGLTSPIYVKTRRGRHYYFKHPGGGAEVRNKVGSNPGGSWYAVPGLDLRGDGGFVVAAGSVNHKQDMDDHVYEFVIPEGIDFDDMPVWNGSPDTIDTSQEFSFDRLDLSSTRITDHNSLDVREQVRELTTYLGRKLQGPDRGDSTDNWMIKYCGQLVRRGVQGQELTDSVADFFTEFFVYHGPQSEAERWLTTKIRSAIEMDRRNHPADYDSSGKRVDVLPVSPEPSSVLPAPALLTPIYGHDVDRILDGLGDVEYHADPIIPQQSIVQVVGYNGHGKSYFLTSLLMAMCAGQKRFGPYEFQGDAPKVFYMDFDNPARTVLSRMKRFNNQFGSTKDRFALWSTAIIPPDQGGDINLTMDEGRNMLGNWLSAVKPNIVVLDTVRNAFGGFDENSAQEWFKVNHMAKMIRDYYKATVILVHHRNKPNDSGLGREAGSTAQLTNIDTQIIVTQCYDDKDTSKKKAGIYSGEAMVTIPGLVGGGEYPVHEYLATRAKHEGHPNSRIRMMSEISFGKVRQATELHETHYIGYMEELADGASFISSTKSKKQMAQYLYDHMRTPIVDISRGLMIPAIEIERWVKPKLKT